MREMIKPVMLGTLLSMGIPAASAQNQVRLEVVDYEHLKKKVHEYQGSVVLVDFWFEGCIPCKKEFPKLVALQNAHRAEGLRTIAVNVDDPSDGEVKASVREFLREQRSTCLNVMLDEKLEVWQEKLKIKSLPCVFLFDRQGRLLTRWDSDEVDYEVITRRVRRALATKGE